MTVPSGWDGPKYFAAQLAPEPVRTDWTPPTGDPGIIQPRPLSFGDLLGAVFGAVRYSPGTMFGLTVILVLGSQLAGMGVGYLLGQEFGSSLLTSEDPTESFTLSWAGLVGIAATLLAQLVIGVGLSWATFQAVRAKKTPPMEALRRIGARFWAMIGLSLLPLVAAALALATIGFLSAPQLGGPGLAVLFGLAMAAVAAWLSVRLLLAPAAIAIESRGPIGAIRRSWTLTRGRFWRIGGSYLATNTLISMATSVLSTIFSFAGALIASSNPELAATVMLTSSTLASIIFSLPLTSALTTLLYVDARIRTEAFDLELSEELFG